VSALAVYKLNAFLAARQTRILAGSIFNLGVATEKFFLTMSKNPWTAIVAIILAAGGAVYRYVKALNDVDKAYSDMSKQQSEITSKFFKAKDLDERKRALKDLIDYANKEYSIKVNLDLEGMSDEEVRAEMNNLRDKMIKANAFGAEFQKEWIRTNQKSSTGKWWDIINPLIGQGMNKDIDQILAVAHKIIRAPVHTAGRFAVQWIFHIVNKWLAALLVKRYVDVIHVKRDRKLSSVNTDVFVIRRQHMEIAAQQYVALC
jgi:hypothetical protein